MNTFTKRLAAAVILPLALLTPVPASAGVGSAVGFLRAPIAFEVVRSRFVRFSAFDPAAINAMFAEMAKEATDVVNWLNPSATGELRAACMESLMWSLSIAVKRDAALTTRDPALERAYGAACGRKPRRETPRAVAG